MSKRPSPVQLIAAREVLRERFEAQQLAAAGYFTAAERAAKLRGELTEIEREQAKHVAALAAATDPPTAARLVGWTTTRVREALQTLKTAQAPRADNDETMRSSLDGPAS